MRTWSCVYAAVDRDYYQARIMQMTAICSSNDRARGLSAEDVAVPDDPNANNS